jgi:hypothetical protein
MGHQKVKMQQWKVREKNFSDYCPAEKRVHFFGNEGILRRPEMMVAFMTIEY